MTPRGGYLAWEAAQLAGVSGSTIGQWARRGYIRSSVQQATPLIYSFQDVAEALVVHDLLDRGVIHRDVRRAIDRLGEYGDWPLSGAPLATVPADAGARLVLRRDDVTYDVGDLGWQLVVERDYLDVIRGQLGRGGWVVRLMPDLEHIEVDPDRLSGRPTIRGRRIAVQDVVALASAPDGTRALAEGYGVGEAEIADARRWWRGVSGLEAA